MSICAFGRGVTVYDIIVRQSSLGYPATLGPGFIQVTMHLLNATVFVTNYHSYLKC